MISADCIASAIVAACSETGADPLDVMDPNKRGPLQQPIVNTRRAVLLGWPGSRNAILTLAARLKWWKTVSSAKVVLKQALELGEADAPPARAAAEAFAEFLAPNPEPDPDPVAAPLTKAPAAPALRAQAELSREHAPRRCVVIGRHHDDDGVDGDGGGW